MSDGVDPMDKYARPYCDDCKLIYRTGTTANCTQCGRPLQLKSFDPWKKVMIGVALIAVGVATVVLADVPIIWIGAFIWAISLMVSGFRQWSEIKDLDDPLKSQYVAPPRPVRELRDDKKHVVVNCGGCFHQYRVRRGQGLRRSQCPNCGREARIST